MRTRSIATTEPLHGCPRTQIFGAVATQLPCPSCRGEIPTGAAFCPACGTPSPTVISNERAAASPPPPPPRAGEHVPDRLARALGGRRSEEHTSELQSQSNLVCRLLLEKKKFT